MASSSSEQESEYEETFKKGTIVEVSSEDEGLRGSWYTATVIRSLSRKTYKILVEYHNLFADDAGSKPLRESVDAILVRPIPPREPHRVFSLMDDVDAFHHDGWWEGVVTKVFVLEPSKNYCYSVFFRCSREQIDFCPQDLRLHREWVRGNLWVPPLEHHCASPSSGARKRSGEDGRNGYHLAGDMDRGTGNGRDVRRKSGNTPTKQGLTMNGNCTLQRRSNSRIINNGASKKQGLTTYGNVKRSRK
ncbi:protein AGENET DOMAIN (AGD)-CONTAINING P1-like [Amaranthus tricolor]|uniref:protein AGENET DOMAIN (AGD)-CONTAINING P1-like n=1 Tax=Amaranthus tricolor TaxID=29722 RepID=UPI002584555D|nr:protein AGENET DOMAIN (AGD)-CONTAINING P1-like [Amaranthus tricolor]